MLDGITILNTFTDELIVKEYLGYDGLWSIGAIILLCALLGVFIYGIFIKEINFLTIILYLWCSFMLVFIGFWHQEKADVPTYKVLISEEVSMTDFNNKYEIIEQEGLIYTIREKDWKEKYGNS